MLSHHDLALLAKAAYSGPQSVTIGDARACLVPRGDELVVVCPGTHPAELADWIRDLDWWPEWFADIGPCHRGFGSGAVALSDRIGPELRRDGLVSYLRSFAWRRAGDRPCGSPRFRAAFAAVPARHLWRAAHAGRGQLGDVAPSAVGP